MLRRSPSPLTLRRLFLSAIESAARWRRGVNDARLSPFHDAIERHDRAGNRQTLVEFHEERAAKFDKMAADLESRMKST